MNIHKSIVYQFLSKVYHRKPWLPNITDIKKKLDTFFQVNDQVTVIQVGANDGVNNDFLFKYSDSIKVGILLEPMPINFTKLLANYKSKNQFILLNYALDKVNGIRNLYHLSFSASRWATGLASFNKEIILKHFENGYVFKMAAQEGIAIPTEKNKWIESSEVNTITFKEIVKRYDLAEVNLLMIDTEGFDHEVIKMFPFSSMKPNIILFEHMHLSDNNYRDTLRILRSKSYRCYREGRDTMAILN